MIGRNPLLKCPARPLVHVAQGGGPYANARRALEPIDLAPVRGRRVLLKPNVGRVASPGAGITTHPEVVAAAIDAFREAGADVVVGESPIVGVEVGEAFAAGGIAAVAAARRCPLLDMDQPRFVKMPVPKGQAIRSLKVCREVVECDLVVSIPVMKMHMHTGVTLAVKNMKGCLWRRSKVEFHMLPPVEGTDQKPIDVAIADLASVLRPHLALIDGTVGMEGLGPSAGEAKPLDVVLASADAFSADAVACRLMGTEARHIAHLRLGSERGYGVIDLSHMTVTPSHWADWISPFSRPPENLTIEFPNVTVLDSQSCSACQSTLLLFLTHYRDRLFDDPAATRGVNIAIGRGHAEVPQGTLCLGNCTLPRRDQGLFVPGCPPVGSQILTALSGRLSVDRVDGNRRDEPGE